MQAGQPNAKTIEPPWYRQFWPWVVIGLPAAAVVASFATLYLAGALPPMVISDYGRIDAINTQELGRDHEASVLGLTARLTFGTPVADGSRELAVEIDEAAVGRLPAAIRIDFIHPTLERDDRHVDLQGAGPVYRGVVGALPGRYYVQVTDAARAWRLTGELAPGSSGATLVARTQSAAEAGP